MGCSPSWQAEGLSRRIMTVVAFAEKLNALTQDMIVCAPTSPAKETESPPRKLIKVKRHYREDDTVFEGLELECEEGIEIEEVEILKKTYSFNRV